MISIETTLGPRFTKWQTVATYELNLIGLSSNKVLLNGRAVRRTSRDVLLNKLMLLSWRQQRAGQAVSVTIEERNGKA